MVKEWDLLRTVACLSILLLHTTTWIGLPSTNVLDFSAILLCYATPTFVLLSVIILTHKYSKELPNNFWANRLQFILLPFLFFAVVDAVLPKYLFDDDAVLQNLFKNIFLGEFVGWFVVVILQLYLLFWLMMKYKWSPYWVLPIGALISLIHYSIVFDYRYKLIFTVWLIYFAIAYILGIRYKETAQILKKYRYFTIIAVLLSGFLVYTKFSQGYITTNSGRIDLIPFVTSITCFIIAWGQVIPYFGIVRLISKYAFSIYLLHWSILDIFASWFIRNINSLLMQVVVTMIWTLFVAIFVTKLISFLPFGKWITGKLRDRTV